MKTYVIEIHIAATLSAMTRIEEKIENVLIEASQQGGVESFTTYTRNQRPASPAKKKRNNP